MRYLIRIVALLATASVVATAWMVSAFASADGVRALVASGFLGLLTIVGWVITLVIGPVAVVQLWRFRESGRRASVVLFGYGLAYNVLGLLALRTAEASIWPILEEIVFCALPLVVLLSPRARLIFAAQSNGAG